MTVEALEWRRGLVCASGLIYWAGVLIQARRIRQRIGRAPNLKPRGVREKALWFGWFMVILVWVGQPWWVRLEEGGPGLGGGSPLLGPVGFGLGVALIVLGYAGTLWTYASMGDAWRIGVNPKERTVLVQRGPYRWVRHPIYALQIVMLAGVAVLLPTPLSLAVLVAHYLCVRLKARDEEEHLTRVHGELYRDYTRRTGRLFPGLRLKPRAPSDQVPTGH